MAIAFQWLVRIAAALIAISSLGVFMVYYLASRSLPDYDASVDVAGISAAVEVVRDNANVPHIFGETDEDVLFALGFAHAQDRLWQMMVMRRTAQGRLSEVFGNRTLDIDTFVRRLDLYNLSVASVDALDPQTQTLLKAYARGVNARFDQINDDALGRGAPELFLFNMPIATWQPADSIAIIKLMGLQLSGHLEEEVLRARVSLQLRNDDRIRDILPDAPGQGVASLPEYSQLVPGTTPGTAYAAQTPHPLSPFRPRGLSGASNAWAADQSRSASGGTLLANDPHLGLTAPSIWYLARLELETGGVIGGTIPGVPIVLTGRSDTLGWGLTTAYVDDQDLYIEELNPENPQEYRSGDDFVPFRTKRSIVNIKDADPVTLTLRWTENGPVLPGSVKEIRAITPPGHVAALAWTVLSDKDTTLAAGMDMMRGAKRARGHRRRRTLPRAGPEPDARGSGHDRAQDHRLHPPPRRQPPEQGTNADAGGAPGKPLARADAL